MNLFVPGARRRRRIASTFSRGFLCAARIPFTVLGRDRLPQGPCVVVANHASYIDGLVAIAALPPDFAFVIKKEMVRVPLAGLLLRRLGSEFVERFNRHKGASIPGACCALQRPDSHWCSSRKAHSMSGAVFENSWGAPSRPPRERVCRL